MNQVYIKFYSISISIIENMCLSDMIKALVRNVFLGSRSMSNMSPLTLTNIVNTLEALAVVKCVAECLNSLDILVV